MKNGGINKPVLLAGWDFGADEATSTGDLPGNGKVTADDDGVEGKAEGRDGDDGNAGGRWLVGTVVADVVDIGVIGGWTAGTVIGALE